MFSKKIILTLLGILLFFTMEAQVTIGSTLEPNSGAILDLKEKAGAGVNSTRGLLMPRVALQKKNGLEPVVNGATTVNDKKAHTGLYYLILVQWS